MNLALMVVWTVVIGQMENVTLVKKVFMGMNATIIALQNAKAISVLSSQERVLPVKQVFMDRAVINHVADVSMEYTIRPVVSVKKDVMLVSMVIIVIKVALRVVRMVVVGQMVSVTLAKMDFMGLYVPAHAQQTARVDSVIGVQGTSVLMVVRIQDYMDKDVTKGVIIVWTMTVARMEHAKMAVHWANVVRNAMRYVKSYQEVACVTRQHVWWTVSLHLKTRHVHQVCDYDHTNVNDNYLLGKGGYVFGSVGLSVCLFVCL